MRVIEQLAEAVAVRAKVGGERGRLHCVPALWLGRGLRLEWRGEILADAKLLHERYELPDGTVLQLGAERQAIPEVLFAPEEGRARFASAPLMGIHQMAYNAINSVDNAALTALHRQSELENPLS